MIMSGWRENRPWRMSSKCTDNWSVYWKTSCPVAVIAGRLCSGDRTTARDWTGAQVQVAMGRTCSFSLCIMGSHLSVWWWWWWWGDAILLLPFWDVTFYMEIVISFMGCTQPCSERNWKGPKALFLAQSRCVPMAVPACLRPVQDCTTKKKDSWAFSVLPPKIKWPIILLQSLIFSIKPIKTGKEVRDTVDGKGAWLTGWPDVLL